MSWIKLESHTADKLEVFAMAQELGIDPDAVLGKCIRVWSWFDANTVDGVTKSVTKVMLDRQCGVTGFCDSMVNAGWMHDDGISLHLPYYDRHNSKSAKSRALGAKRQSKFKSVTNSVTGSVTQCVTEALPESSHREEKRREESSASSRGTRIPEDWHPTPEETAFCKTERPDLKPSEVAKRFFDYWTAVPGSKGRKTDWSATWRNWVRNDKPGKEGAAPTEQVWE